MSSPRPLTYLSSRCVLQYLDADARIRLSTSCPSIRATDKIVPKRTAFLDLEPYTITVNNTKYELGLIRHYPPGLRVPPEILFSNKNGGMKNEVDELGFKKWETEVIPGDLVLARYGELEPQNRLLMVSGCSERYEKLLLMTSEREKELRADILQDLIPYRLKFNREKYGESLVIAFTHYICLTMHTRENRSSNWEIKHTEMMAYDRTLAQAMKYLTSKILCKPNLRAHTLQISRDPAANECVFRLPADLKMVVKNLKVNNCNRSLLDAFRPIFDTHSFPLTSFEESSLNYNMERNHFVDPIISTSRCLISADLQLYRHNCHHHRVHVRSEVVYDNVLVLTLTQWIERDQEIGTHHLYTVLSKAAGDAVFNRLTRFTGAVTREIDGKGCFMFRNSIIAPMNETSEALLYAEEAQGSSAMDGPWNFHFEVIPRASVFFQESLFL